MRKARVTFKGAFHHITCRALDGKNIFEDVIFKKYLIKLLKKYSKLTKIKIIAYCIMDNHYHLILKNSNGKMDAFMRMVNGCFGLFYRRKTETHGFVFSDRFFSRIIENDEYMKMSVVYVLLNPFKAGIADNPFEYPFSSINSYYGNDDLTWIDRKFVREMFQKESNFRNMLKEWKNKNIPLIKTDFGEIIGEREYLQVVKKKFNRRKKTGRDESANMRKAEIFKTKEEIIAEFLEFYGIEIKDLEKKHPEARELRNYLLVRLKEEGGLTYKEINKISAFKTLRFSYIIKLYNSLKRK